MKEQSILLPTGRLLKIGKLYTITQSVYIYEYNNFYNFYLKPKPIFTGSIDNVVRIEPGPNKILLMSGAIIIPLTHIPTNHHKFSNDLLSFLHNKNKYITFTNVLSVDELTIV